MAITIQIDVINDEANMDLKMQDSSAEECVHLMRAINAAQRAILDKYYLEEFGGSYIERKEI